MHRHPARVRLPAPTESGLLRLQAGQRDPTEDQLKLIDLGAVTDLARPGKFTYGTVGYQAPEIETVRAEPSWNRTCSRSAARWRCSASTSPLHPQVQGRAAAPSEVPLFTNSTRTTGCCYVPRTRPESALRLRGGHGRTVRRGAARGGGDPHRRTATRRVGLFGPETRVVHTEVAARNSEPGLPAPAPDPAVIAGALPVPRVGRRRPGRQPAGHRRHHRPRRTARRAHRRRRLLAGGHAAAGPDVHRTGRRGARPGVPRRPGRRRLAAALVRGPGRTVGTRPRPRPRVLRRGARRAARRARAADRARRVPRVDGPARQAASEYRELGHRPRLRRGGVRTGRCQLATGDRAGAVRTLESVPDTSANTSRRRPRRCAPGSAGAARARRWAPT